MSLQAHIRPAAGKPLGALVLLHGRGADEHDLAGFADELDPQRRLLAALPRAPFPEGFGARWYRLRQLPEPDPGDFAGSLEALAAWLREVLAGHGVDPARTVLGGFSQGSTVSLAFALSPGAPPVGGLLCLSGFLAQTEGFQPDLSRVRGLPVFMNHGLLDPRIPVQWGQQARDALQAAGATLTYREFRGGHEIDYEGFLKIKDWMGDLLRQWEA